MKEECLICKAPIEYLEQDIEMECLICHKKEYSKTRCINGHYVCSECHMKGIDAVINICLNETSKNPIFIMEKLMSQPFCHMHGPEHHIMVGSALLTAYKNAGGELNLEKALTEMQARGKDVPGGICGFWGSCGAAVSTGIFMSIITGSNPLAKEVWGLCNLMTSESLKTVGSIGGPRCCKRNSYLTISTAIDFVKEHFGIEMEKTNITCSRSEQNNQCLKEACPFHKVD